MRGSLLLLARSVSASGIAVLIAGMTASATADETDMGAVLGQTVTVAGQEFFQSFVALWREKSLSERYLIVVRERPAAKTGSLIWVEHRGRRLLQLPLPASRGLLRSAGQQAAEEVWQRLTQEEIEAHLQGDTDLARDEL